MSTCTCLVADPCPQTRDKMMLWLSIFGHYGLAATTCSDAMAVMREHVPEIVFLDAALPGMEIDSFILCAEKLTPPPSVVLMVPRGNRTASLSSNVDAVLCKPVKFEDVKALLARICPQYALHIAV